MSWQSVAHHEERACTIYTLTEVPQFVRIDELDVLHVHPKGEGHGCPESQFVRIDELDVLHVHPKGEGHGCPESLTQERGLMDTMKAS